MKDLAQPMLSHRMIVSPAARMRGVSSPDVVETILEQTPVPGGRASAAARS